MTPTDRAIAAELARLRPGTTMCAGELARRVQPGAERPLEALRPTLARLALAGRVRVTQRGRPVDPATARGPLRVAPAADQAR